VKFSKVNLVEQVVWNMRLADLPRAENRTIINELFNGDPPFDEDTAEEDQIQINRNDLTGPNVMTQSRRQWMQALVTKPGNKFSVALDSGPAKKRREWSHAITRNANRVLNRSRSYMEQGRAAGAQTVLHGIGPSIWTTRRGVLCKPLPIGSVMIPSETDVDFENLDHIAFFNEWTPAQLSKLVYGNRRDPGWNLELVKAQWKYVVEQVQKQPNATAFQYMPERIEELIKQDMGFWGSDAVPTIDVWDFYFRQDDNGWYRRVFLDWGVEAGVKDLPKSKNGDKNDLFGGFLYTSGKRIFARDINEFFHSQLGDCSAVAPFKVHSIRSLGWMLWGVCDLETRLHCKFSEALFEQLMWFFRVASGGDLTRLRKADFYHFGVIPSNVDMVKGNERYVPDANLINAGFTRFNQLISQAASSFTQDFSGGESGKEMTATETMARVNQVNALVSGLLTLAYTYEEFKDRETMRRLCIKNNPDPLAKKFYLMCMEDKVDPEVLDVDKMDIVRERSMGGGNKTLEMAMVQFLQGIRKNLGPQGQRQVDHISIESVTDDARLAEDLAPVEQEKHVSNSEHDAQLATDRILRGLPFQVRPDMVFEDYVKVWLQDLTVLVTQKQQAGGMATLDEIKGFQALSNQITEFLKIMGTDPELKERVREYQLALTKLLNLVKAMFQRLMQQMKAQARAGGNGEQAKEAAKIRAIELAAQVKAKNSTESNAQKNAQRQVSFELKEQQQEREHQATMRRLDLEHHYNLLTDALRAAGQSDSKPENQ